MKFDELQTLQEVATDDPRCHDCRIYHDEDVASPEEELVVIQIGIEQPFDDGSFPRSLCMDLEGATVSIGCTHSNEVRQAMITTLSKLATVDSQREECNHLIDEVTRIEDRLNNGEITWLEYLMREYRDDETEDGQVMRELVADEHSLLVSGY